jgi:hypothetical protein
MATKLKTAFLIACLTSLSVTAGCAFQIEYPEGMQTRSLDYQVTDNNRMELLVIFNHRVDMTSLMPGTNIVLADENRRNVDFKLIPGANARSIILTTTERIQDFAVGAPDAYLTLNMLGSGPNPVRSIAGQALDGDNSGRAGGNYETTFYLPVARPPAPIPIEVSE